MRGLVVVLEVDRKGRVAAWGYRDGFTLMSGAVVWASWASWLDVFRVDDDFSRRLLGARWVVRVGVR